MRGPSLLYRVLTRGIYLAAAGTVLFCSTSAFAVSLKTEHFTSDPGWLREGDPNLNPSTAHPSNFGFQTSNKTGSTAVPPGGTATAGGEAGGVIGCEVAAAYGDNIGHLSSSDPMFFSGVLEDDTTNQESVLGWYNHSDLTPSPATDGQHIPSFFGIQQQARSAGHHTYSIFLIDSTGSTRVLDKKAFDGDSGGNVVTTGVPTDFSFSYDPNAGANLVGQITVFIDHADSNDATPSDDTFTYDLTTADRTALNALSFDRFGMTYSVFKPSGGGPETVFYDDLTYTTNVPEPVCLVTAGSVVLLASLRRRRS